MIYVACASDLHALRTALVGELHCRWWRIVVGEEGVVTRQILIGPRPDDTAGRVSREQKVNTILHYVASGAWNQSFTVPFLRHPNGRTSPRSVRAGGMSLIPGHNRAVRPRRTALFFLRTVYPSSR
jgi:hypothetical protein